MASCGGAGRGNEAMVLKMATQEVVARRADRMLLPVCIRFWEARHINLIGGKIPSNVIQFAVVMRGVKPIRVLK
jgi:hypothetical protein